MIGNWGRWGESDELGAGNLVDADVVRAAAELVDRGLVISLAQPLGPTTPMPRHRRQVARFMDRDAGDYADQPDGAGDFRFADDTVSLPTHAGTHIDALAHAWTGDKLYNGHRVDTQSRYGARRCGADKLRPTVTRGVLLDFVPPGETSLEATAGIGPADLERAYAAAELEPRAADAVLMRTGWWNRHRAEPDLYFASEPGLTTEGAAWLAARDPSLVGADNCAIELMPSPSGETFPVHVVLMRDHGVPLLENLDLAELASKEAREFLFVAAPLALIGSTASPLNPIAVL